MPRSSKPRKRPTGGSIDRLQSGALRVRVEGGVDPVTKRRYRPTTIIPDGPDAESQANEALLRMLNEVNERRHPRTNATVNQLLDEHIKVLHQAESTKRTNRRYIDKHIRPLIGDQKAGRVDAHILESFYSELLRCRSHCRNKRRVEHYTNREHTCDMRCRQHTCTPLAASTVRKIHFILSGAFERAVRWRWVSDNPCEHATPPPAPAPDPQPPTSEEAARILNAAWSDLDFGSLVWTVMTTGPRRAEVCGLRWRHFDAERELLTYHRTIVQDGIDLWESDTKTHQRRNVALDPQTVAVLSDYKAHCEKRAEALGVKLTSDSFIFSAEPDGTAPLKPSSLTQRYNRLAERLGIDTTLHKLRHYSATELITAGVDIRTVAGRLGHAGGGTTTLKVYAAWVAEADQRASTALMNRVPDKPSSPPDPIERAKTSPQTPYERIAAHLREDILARRLQPGEHAPTLKQLQAQHCVGAGTAHRALGLLKEWGLIESARGLRAVILDPAADESDSESASQQLEPAPVSDAHARPLDLTLIYLGSSVRTFTAKADPTDTDQLHRLLTAAVRRHGGRGGEISDYELEVRHDGTDDPVTTYVAL